MSHRKNGLLIDGGDDIITSRDGSPVKAFRGFPGPCVVLPRVDITRYFSPTIKEKDSPTPARFTEPTTSGKLKPILKENSRKYFDKFAAKCFVNIMNDDLTKLKELISTNPGALNQRIRSPKMILKCKICEKVYSSMKKLLNHEKNKHMIIKANSKKRVSFSDEVIVHELKEYHRCRKCPKIFEDYKALKSHMREQHKKRKCYICNYCCKKFVDRMFFKVHIKLHCEACGQLFTSKTKCNEHKRTVCKILKLFKCKTCDISFFKLMDLKDHSYEHISDCFVCDICKDQCSTKCAIAHHIYFLHCKRIKRRNPCLYITRKLCTESLFLCKFCDESSVDRFHIEQHVQQLPDLNNRVMTGYKDYYFCDQCLKKFDTETDMLQHKWTHFLKSPDNSQIRLKNMLLDRKREIKTIYNVNEEIPNFLKPTVVLEKININGKVLNETKTPEYVDVPSLDAPQENIKKPVVDPKSKKTIISKHQCPNCGKYYSSNYCLNRHIETQHSDFENLQCKVCEEVFVWPSLLRSHRCIRTHIPEMPFDDARPEIHFDNLHQIEQSVAPEICNGFDDLNIAESENYLNTIDFEIPAPIVELTEYEMSNVLNTSDSNNVHNGEVNPLNKVSALQRGYKVVMQEVPIEF